MKFNENRSKGSGDVERTRKCYGRNGGLSHKRFLLDIFYANKAKSTQQVPYKLKE